jgi:hypothetical protein
MTFRNSSCHRSRRRIGCDGPTLERRVDAGPDGDDRPTVISSEWVGGERRSTIVRADGSTFAVTVPAMGMDEGNDSVEWAHDWITGDGGGRHPMGLSQLHRAVLCGWAEEPALGTRRAEQEAH